MFSVFRRIMAGFELHQKITTLESEIVRQNEEIGNLKTEISNLKTVNARQTQEISNLRTENARQSQEIANLKMENQSLHTKVDELKSSMEFMVKKYNELDKRIAGTSTIKDNTAHELAIDVPMEVLPTVPKQSDCSSIKTAEDVKTLEDQFAKLPAEKLAAEMWISAMKNLPELNGPATIALMEEQKKNFAQFITSVASKENFSDAVKNTCRERGFSKGIVKKIQKIINDMTVQNNP